MKKSEIALTLHEEARQRAELHLQQARPFLRGKLGPPQTGPVTPDIGGTPEPTPPPQRTKAPARQKDRGMSR